MSGTDVTHWDGVRGCHLVTNNYGRRTHTTTTHNNRQTGHNHNNINEVTDKESCLDELIRAIYDSLHTLERALCRLDLGCTNITPGCRRPFRRESPEFLSDSWSQQCSTGTTVLLDDTIFGTMRNGVRD